MHELRGVPDPTLEQHPARLSPCNLVLVEGFKIEAIAKLEAHRLDNQGNRTTYPP
jgi:molybdopterin-guanine dinucleotide biosynthesis adapter protein